MQLTLATLCDSASDYQGKLCVLGTFDTLCANQFPVTHPQCSLALRLLFFPADAGKHTMNIELRDEAGKSLMPAINPAIDVVFPPGGAPFISRNLVLNLQRLAFEKAGLYFFSISVNEKQLIALPVRVARFEDLRASVGPAG